MLRTPNLQPMVDFYLTFLGGSVTYGNESASFITYDEEHHRIALLQVPDMGPKPATSRGLEHLSFSFHNLSDLLLAYQQRKANGITPAFCINHGPTTSLYYKDPDANLLETQVDNFATVAETNAYIATPEFSQNAFGVEFDPEELVARMKSGESDADLKRRPNIGPREIPNFDSM